MIYPSAGGLFINIAFAAKHIQRIQNPGLDLVDKQVEYMSTVSNLSVDRSLKHTNLIKTFVKHNIKTEIVDDYPQNAEEIKLFLNQTLIRA